VPYYPYFSFVQRPYESGAERHRLLEQSVTVPSATTDAIGDACRQAENSGLHWRERTRRGHDLQHTVVIRRRRYSDSATAQDFPHLPRTYGLGIGRWIRTLRCG
jgi:aliphatic nitrilase